MSSPTVAGFRLLFRGVRKVRSLVMLSVGLALSVAEARFQGDARIDLSDGAVSGRVLPVPKSTEVFYPVEVAGSIEELALRGEDRALTVPTREEPTALATTDEERRASDAPGEPSDLRRRPIRSDASRRCSSVVCPTPKPASKGLQPRDINSFWMARDSVDPEKGAF